MHVVCSYTTCCVSLHNMFCIFTQHVVWLYTACSGFSNNMLSDFMRAKIWHRRSSKLGSCPRLAMPLCGNQRILLAQPGMGIWGADNRQAQFWKLLLICNDWNCGNRNLCNQLHASGHLLSMTKLEAPSWFTDFQKYKDVFPNLFSRKSILNLVFFPRTTCFGERNESHHPRILAITINVHTIQLIEQLIFLCGIFDAWVSVGLVIAKWHYGQGWSKNSQALSHSFRLFKNSGCISMLKKNEKVQIGILASKSLSWTAKRKIVVPSFKHALNLAQLLANLDDAITTWQPKERALFVESERFSAIYAEAQQIFGHGIQPRVFWGSQKIPAVSP